MYNVVKGYSRLLDEPELKPSSRSSSGSERERRKKRGRGEKPGG
jgi:hypothetical protein